MESVTFRTNHQQWYTGTNSAHWSLQHCSAHCVVNASQCLVTIHILLVFTARQVSDFWLLILRRESRARLTESESGPKLRLRGPETRAGARSGSSALRVGSTGNRDWEMYPSEFLADVLTQFMIIICQLFSKVQSIQKLKPQKYHKIYLHTIVHNFIFCGHVWYYHFTSAEAPGRVLFALLLLQTMLHNEMIVEKNTFPRKLLSVPSQIFSTLSKIYTTNKKDSSNIFIESLTFNVKHTKHIDFKRFSIKKM